MKPARSALALAASLATFAAAPPPALAAAEAAPVVTAPVRVPGGVTDAEGTIVLVRTPAGAVEAVDGATGASLWFSAAPARALLVARGIAYVLEQRGPGALRVLAIEPRTAVSAASWPLPSGALPGWAGLGAGGGRVVTTVAVAARLVNATLEVALDARQVTLGGMGLIPGPEARAIVRINTRSGAAEVAAGERVRQPPLAVPPPSGVKVRLARFHVRVADELLVLGGPPPDVEGVLAAGDVLVGFEWAPAKVSVHRFAAATGAPAPPVEILAETDAIWVTLDRHHIALRRARDQRLVDLHALEGGARIATLEAAFDIAVVAGRVWWTRRAGAEVVLSVLDPERERTLWRRTLARYDDGPLGEPIP